MITQFVDMKNAALASIVDWAQNNRNYETMQTRVGDFIDMFYGKEPTDISVAGIIVHRVLRAGIAQGLLFAICDKIPEDKFGDAMLAMKDITCQLDQRDTSTTNQSNKK